jgi:hypothetical protein
MMFKRIVTLVIALFGFCVATASAQGINGSFAGGVTDQTGAVVPAALITATNIDTKVTYTAKTTSEGRYALPALPVGTYQVEVVKAGFKTDAATNIKLDMQQTVTLDFKLEVGAASETVTVTTEAPLLDRLTSEVGDSMDDKTYHELPNVLSGGLLDPQAFIFQSLPGTIGNSWQGSINGGQQMATDVLIDGLTLGRYDINGDMVEDQPSVEAIGEFKLLANNYSAEFGGTSTGIESFEMKSGTNEFHGGLWEYHRNKVLDARGWNVNTYDPYGTNAAGGANKAPDIQNDFGGAFGGPVWIPKVYNGHKKTFFYYVWDHVHVTQPTVGGRTSLPDPLELQGNLSESLGPQIGTDALGRPVYQGEAYDPATTRTVNGNVVRDGFGFDPVTGLPTATANIVPSSRFSTVSKAVMTYIKGFNYINPSDPGLWNNVPILGQSPFEITTANSIKIDHEINSKHKLSGFYNWSHLQETPLNSNTILTSNFYNPIGRGNSEQPKSYLGRLSEDWTINDHTLNHAALGYNRWYNPNHSVSYGQKDWSQALGLPGTGPQDFPRVAFASTGGYGLVTFGDAALTTEISEGYTYADNLTYSRGKHELKTGVELRRYRLNYPAAPIGDVHANYSNAETGLPGYLNGSNTNGIFQSGNPWASFLLGQMDSESNSYNPYGTGTRAGLVALFVQDNWKIAPRLSLNLGLRWDIPIPRTETHGIQCNFDPTLPNPDASGALGAMQYLKSTGRHSIQDHYWKDVAPRLGFNYELNNKTVIRGGYGISFSAPILNDFQDENTQGYSGNLSLNHGNPDPRLPNPGGNAWDLVTDWDLGVPAFTQKLPVTDPGFADFDQQGGGANWLRPNSLRGPYTQQWSFGFQRDLGWESALEVNYIGTKGSRLWSQGWTLNGPDPKYYAMLDPATGNQLINYTYSQLSPADWAVLQANGVNGLPYASFPSWGSVYQGVSRWPQMSGVSDVASNWGDAHYNSLQVSWKKRPVKSGLLVMANYTYSKLITNAENACCGGAGGAGGTTQWANFNNRLERSVSDMDYTHLAKLTWVYDLPFGSGRQLLNRHGVVNQLAGGWSVSAIQNYGSGDPLEITTQGWRADAIGNIKSADGHAKGALNPNGTPYLNVPAATFDANGCKGPFCMIPTSADGYPLRPGTSSRYYGQLRGPWQPTETAGILKEFHFSEKRYFEIRANFFNLLNRTGRGDPDTNLQDSTFGLIQNPWGNPRSIQFTGHLYF